MSDNWQSNRQMEQERIAWIPPDGAFEKRITSAGQGKDLALEGAECTICVTPLSEGHSLKWQTDLPCNCHTMITLGLSGSPFIETLEKCIQTMKEGEVCICSWSETESNVNVHDAEGNETSRIGCAGKVEVEIFLKSFAKSSEPWQLETAERLTRAKVLKARGTELFQQGNILFAFKKFSRALKYLVCLGPVKELSNAQQAEVQTLKTICYLNLSACQLKYNDYDLVISNCTMALEIECNNVKGLYRRAQAYMYTNALENAKADLLKALEEEPTNKAVTALLRKIQADTKKQDATVASGLAKYFS